MSAVLLIPLVLLLTSCSPEPNPAPPPEPPKPHDESRRFPISNLVDTKVVDKQLLGKPFMPGGTLASYKKGKTEYQMFVAKLPTATDAAVILPDWRKPLTDSKLIASFRASSSPDNNPPAFLF